LLIPKNSTRVNPDLYTLKYMTTVEFCTQLVRHESVMLKYAYSFNLKRDDAKDLVQDTYMKALLNRDKYVDNEKLKAWVLAIMRNTFVDSYRRSSMQKKLSDPVKEAVLVNAVATDGGDDPDTLLTALEIESYVEKMKDKLRLPFQMYVDGFKYSEISEKLNLKIGTVKSRIFLSRRYLMNLLK
jgi:RNA polymerase sigma factor (sigma-70 family)